MGNTHQLSAAVVDSNNRPVAGIGISWSSSSTLVATVDGSGLVRAVGAGAARITAAAGSVRAQVVVTVKEESKPTTIVVRPSTASLGVIGATIQLSAEVRDQQNRVMTDVDVSWSSDDTAVASVDSVGLVTATGKGMVRISAGAGTVTGSMVISVLQQNGTTTPAPGDDNADSVDTEGVSTDRRVLVALYNATDGPNWQYNEGWLSDEPLGNWAGVETDPHTGRVTVLRLVANGLNGQIPPELGDLAGLKTLDLFRNRLTGRIPAELGNLVNLEILKLLENELSGTIPAELGRLHKLETLDLLFNKLSGKIPAELGNLVNLEKLELSENELSGTIPAELGRLSNLETIGLANNRLSDELPPELGSMSNLRSLYFTGNRITGSIPSTFGRLGKLQDLVLSDNLISGELPPELGSMSNLRSLHLTGNRITGSIPATFGRLAELKVLDLSYNLVSSELPPELGGMSNLRTFQLIGNRITGSIPSTFGRLGNLLVLDLSGNLVSGELPPELGGMRNLGTLSLQYNLISGPIPPGLVSLGNLQELYLQGNRLSGEIPYELSGMTRVRVLRLDGNQLSGEIPSGIGDLSTLRILDLSNNELTGRIPPEMGNLDGLQALHMQNNNLQDAIPPELGNLDGLLVLNLHENDLEDTIPPELGNLRSLQRLDLTRNELTGEIIPELGNLSNLQELFLGGNQLSGEIPPDLGRLTSLKELFLWDSQLSGSIPSELGGLHNLEWLAVGNNQLTGNIPPELGLLENLSRLNLSSNRLSGSIPPELGNLKSLSSLVLIYNDFTGELPSELIQLDQLTYFLAYDTRLCLPTDAAFQRWIYRFPDVGLPNCETTVHTVQLVPDSVRIDSGETVQFVATVTDADGQTVPEVGVTWSSGDDSVASVDMEGLVTAHMNGTTTITARSERVAAQARLIVGAPSVQTRLTIQPDDLDFHAVGANKLLNVLVYDQHGRIMENASVSWRSDDPAVAAVDPDGLVTAAGEGMTRVSAESGEASASISVTVMQQIRAISLTPGSAVLATGDDLRIEAVVLDSQKTPIAWSLPDWTTEDESVATVDANGLVFAVGAGTAMITASVADISNSAQITVINDIDREVLGALYNATNGHAWKDNTGWLSDEPLNNWSKVETDPETGRVYILLLNDNGLSGRIPPELGSLDGLRDLNLANNQLYGDIPPELGSLQNLEYLSLSSNSLTGEIPQELSEITRLRVLDLSFNPLRGGLPSSLGDLSSLRYLYAEGNELSGELPVTLGKLSNLERLSLFNNRFTGGIPSEFGNLSNLQELFLDGNTLTGILPADLGNLENLEVLNIAGNRLSGEIPAEFGSMINLRRMILSGNQLTGTIPPELGGLSSLEALYLSYNYLSGNIPSALGSASLLREMRLSNNQLTGEIPPELGLLRNLEHLELFYNDLSGGLPLALTALSKLEELYLSGTEICASSDKELQNWIDQLEGSRISNCEAAFRTDGVVAYLTQAVQSPTNPVPLVAGEPALLRVFLTSDRESDILLPPVRAMFYNNGSQVHTEYIPGQELKIHAEINEGSLSESVNATVPASIITPGLEMVIEIDPDGTLDPGSGVGMRIPESGRTEVHVAEVPEFNLTLIPFLWEHDPDFTVVTETEGISADHELFRQTRDNLPVVDFNLTVHDPVWTSVDPSTSNQESLILDTELIQTIEGQPGYYMGTITGRWGGYAWLGGTVSVAPLSGSLIAHELGHNMSLDHAPCGGAGSPDRHFPNRIGAIGAWGYDHITDTLISPDTPDLMGYCGHPDDTWISDYFFAKALNHRQFEEPQYLAVAPSAIKNLVLWGGVNGDGNLSLNPAFVVGSLPSLPQSPGPYLLTGEDSAGNTLFDLSFDTGKISHAPGVSFFAFSLPVQPEWADELVKITFSGPEGAVTIGASGDAAAALLMDPATGQVRGVLRNIPAQDPSRLSARRVMPEAGLDMVISRGIPDSTDW